MDAKDIEKFDPTVAELTKMVEATKGITAKDLEDTAQLAVVRENRISLKKARVQIEKKGKELREDAIAFQRAVIGKEKELISIIEPEELRLRAIEEEADALAIRKERLVKLPQRKERIAMAGYSLSKTDEELLGMDANAFEAYFNELGAAKVESDRKASEKATQEADEASRLERETEDAKRAVAEAAKKAEQDAKDAELRAREEAVREAERKAAHEREVMEAAEKAAKEAREKAQREALEKADAEKAEKERLEKEEAERKAAEQKKAAYVAFLKEHGYTKETAMDFHTEETSTAYVLYKKVGEFKKQI